MLIAKKPGKNNNAMNYIGYEVTTNETSRAGNKPSKMQRGYNK